MIIMYFISLFQWLPPVLQIIVGGALWLFVVIMTMKVLKMIWDALPLV